MILLLVLAARPVANVQAQLPPVVFMEARPGVARDADSTYVQITDSARLTTYRSWLDNESARFALHLYEVARDLARRDYGDGGQPDAYHIALVPGGNHASVGFRVVGPDGRVAAYPHGAYMLLDAQDWRFTTTFLHETGHVALGMLAGGRRIPSREVAPIPHTVAALTDRGTAFDEGFAIHLETLMAHIGREAWLRNKYHHEQFLFGDQPGGLAEYYRQTSDLLTFAQTVGRYALVRDNHFAFAPAWKGADYVRVELEPARDVAALRDPNQLLQSEGFYASVLFGMLMRGRSLPDSATIWTREETLLAAAGDALRRAGDDPDAPFLIYLVESLLGRTANPDADVVDPFLDLSHGVFVDPGAAALWRRHYLASLSLDLAQVDRDSINAARGRWRTAVLADPAILYSRLGPQLVCKVADVTVTLPALGDPAPLSFDANTVEEGVLRMVPGVDDARLRSWQKARAERPFADWADLQRRVDLTPDIQRRLTCGS
jgi:hypothetical protein